MAIVGEMEGTQNKMWYKCTRCRHMSLLQQQVKVNPNAVLAQIDLANCITYKPDLVYSVGQFIFHNDLKDAGRIVSKARTSSGGDAIIVNFERIGKKTLIENLRGDFGFEAF
ncbi:MAG: hypothetical protein KGZ58_07095 [Ignavibacteriales bacterium]|nr:hypothetical protein [Ignavibacteriales bacterium]